MKRRDREEHVGREVFEMEVEGSRGRGRPKARWKDCIRNVLREINIDEWTALSRTERKMLICNGEPE